MSPSKHSRKSMGRKQLVSALAWNRALIQKVSLRKGIHVDFAACIIPEHFDEPIGKGVQIDVELAICVH